MKTVADPAVLGGLVARIERLTPDSRRLWGRASVHQMLVHLGDAAEAVLKRRPFSSTNRQPSPVIKIVALYLPFPWPREIQSGADPASFVVEAERFGADRGRAVTTLEEVAAASANNLVDRHPIFGPMSQSQWRRWAFLHVDHHLRQFGL